MYVRYLQQKYISSYAVWNDSVVRKLSKWFVLSIYEITRNYSYINSTQPVNNALKYYDLQKRENKSLSEHALNQGIKPSDIDSTTHKTV